MTLATLISTIVVAVSGHAVPFTCQPGLAATEAAYGLYQSGPGVEEAVPAPGEPGVEDIVAVYPDAHIYIDAGLCRALSTLIADPSGTRLHYQHPGFRNWYEAAALMAVIHEAEHEWQYANGLPYSDPQAQCVALKELPHWLGVIGASPGMASRLEIAARVIAEGMPADSQPAGSC